MENKLKITTSKSRTNQIDYLLILTSLSTATFPVMQKNFQMMQNKQHEINLSKAIPLQQCLLLKVVQTSQLLTKTVPQ